jgi:peptidoglycan/xylan/chitin deacetylase (PgdA/CDA1 family)
VDVCTRIGLKEGVPRLLELLRQSGLSASFFVTLGPETAGRAIRHLWRPTFLLKLLRTRALSSYGIRTLLAGTLLPSREVGAGAAGFLRAIPDEGHEAALHGWDHFGWMDRIEGMEESAVAQLLERAVVAHREAFGAPPLASAAPGWRLTERALLAQERFGFGYASDARGTSPFFPLVNGTALGTLQLPTTLPTLDELMGRARGINDQLLGSLSPGFNVHTIHAELEGRHAFPLFEDFLRRLARARVRVGTLREAALECLSDPESVPRHTVVRGRVGGRSGWVACQGSGTPISGQHSAKTRAEG